MSNVLEEPHYSVPGLIRLGAQDGRRVWEAVRATFQSQLEYGVYDWYDYTEYAEMAERQGFYLEPCYDEQTIQLSRAAEMLDYEGAIDRFEIEFEERLSALPLSEPDRRLLASAGAEYAQTFRRDHETHSPSDPEATRSLFLKYYAQPIAFLLWHKGFPRPFATIVPSPPDPVRFQALRQWVHDRPRIARLARAVRSIIRWRY